MTFPRALILGLMLTIPLAALSCRQSTPPPPIPAAAPPPTSEPVATVLSQSWAPLFNGVDLTGFHTFIKTPGLDNDPQGYFKVEQVDGGPAVHVMDLPLITKKR